MKYDVDVIKYWIKQHGIVVNRVGILNQLLGCRYDFATDNPCALERFGSVYRVRFRDAMVCEYSRYDLPSVLSAVSVLTSWSDCVWQLRRTGCICVDVV